jgi:uncharacterized protein (TIGR02687 family)
MAELNLKQIINRLNTEFVGDTRKLVFWYDDKAEFEEDIKSVVLDNAKVYFLQPDNQFQTKVFLERIDTITNYLIYAPFPKPDVRDNHLEDMVLYSRRFFADRASLLTVDLGIEEKYKPVIEKHIKFFANKERTQRFYDLQIEYFNEETILTGMFSAICHTHTCSFEEAVRVLLADSTLENNIYLEEFKKYELLDSFWKLCEQKFGYTDEKPSLEKFIITLFVTYTDRYVQKELPQAWKSFISYKSGNIIAFLDHLMNNVLYQDIYDKLSAHVSNRLNATSVLSNMDLASLLNCDTFLAIDQIIVKWLVERLLAEDTGANLDNQSIPEICSKRSKMHFGKKTETTYQLLGSAYQLIQAANYTCPDGFSAVIQKYQKEDYKLDREYRNFYVSYDKLEDTTALEPLRDLVENIYTNEYLMKVMPKWSAGILEPDAFTKLPLQRNFYSRFIRPISERIVVIISDAMRYEVGRELFEKMQDNPRCTVKMDAQLSVLPSYTRLGMAALLPHRTLTMSDNYEVYADNVLCNDLAGRETVLKKYSPNSCCIQFDKFASMKTQEMRDVLKGKQIIYIYHNQIDARGDKVNTENEVFTACQEAIQEIADMIDRISKSGNTYRFIVTADHGFIYKRDNLTESDKIGGVSGKNAFVGRRYIISDEPVLDNGIEHLSLGTILGNEDSRVVSFPVNSNIFKVAGGGQNFVHGGSSPQEMLVPVLDIKMERGVVETKNAEIMLVSTVKKITNKIKALDFIQSDPISDTVRQTTYKIYFVSEDNERISNENTYVADNKNPDTSKRIFRMKFQFKDMKYDKDKNYYLVAYDEATGLECFRHSVIMDIAGADDFGFGF